MSNFGFSTRIRIKPSVILSQLELLEADYHRIDPSGDLRKLNGKGNPSASLARSMFSRWNNLRSFYDKIMQKKGKDSIPIIRQYADGSILIDVVAEAKGRTSRLYFKPSVTSLTKEVRKAIIPIEDGNIFLSTDLASAEFALRLVQACCVEALDVYRAGEDIYMYFSELFPEGTEREVIKGILIACMYGQSAYSVGEQLGIPQLEAEALIKSIQGSLPQLEQLKRDIIAITRRKNGYYCPNGYNQQDLIRVSDVDIKEGYKEEKALATYTQSALGILVQDYVRLFQSRFDLSGRTLLTVFDSVLIECNVSEVESLENEFIKAFSPLRPDEFRCGSTMYEAMTKSEVHLV